MLQEVFELGKLGVVIIIDTLPFQPHLIQQFLIFAKHIDIIRIKVIPCEHGIFGIILCFLVQLLLDFIIRVAQIVELVDVHVGSNENTIVLPHVNHVLVGLAEILHGNFECIEAAFQSLHKTVLSDTCQAAADKLRIVVETVGNLWFQVGNSLIAGVSQFLVQSLHGLLKKVGQMVVQFVFLFDGFCHFGEAVNVFVVAGDAFDVRSGAPHSQRLNHPVTHPLSQLFELFQVEVLLLAHFSELHDKR